MAKPDIQAITPERHGQQRWKKLDGFSFAAEDALCPLVTEELGQAAGTMPVAFMPNDQGDFQLLGVVGINDGRNLFVGPDGGWQRGYVPAVYRGYPFMFVNAGQEGENRQVLCLDEASGVISEAPDAEPFFVTGSEPSNALKEVLDYHNMLARSVDLTRQVCALFKELKLLKPWNFTFEKPDGERVGLGGLYQVDEVALNQLSDQDYLKLRNLGGIATAYCQMVSISRITALQELLAAHERGEFVPKAPVPSAETH